MKQFDEQDLKMLVNGLNYCREQSESSDIATIYDGPLTTVRHAKNQLEDIDELLRKANTLICMPDTIIEPLTKISMLNVMTEYGLQNISEYLDFLTVLKRMIKNWDITKSYDKCAMLEACTEAYDGMMNASTNDALITPLNDKEEMNVMINEVQTIADQKELVEAIKVFKQTAVKLDIAWKDGSIGTEEYPFDKNFSDIVCLIDTWAEKQEEIYDDRGSTMVHIIAEQHRNIKPSLFGWIDENTGGHTMIFYKDYICRDGKQRLIGLDESGVALYDVTYATMGTSEWSDRFDLGQVMITNIETDWHTGRYYYTDLFDWLTADQIDDITRGQNIYLGKYAQ